jgi:hypothetical protein
MVRRWSFIPAFQPVLPALSLTPFPAPVQNVENQSTIGCSFRSFHAPSPAKPALSVTKRFLTLRPPESNPRHWWAAADSEIAPPKPERF